MPAKPAMQRFPAEVRDAMRRSGAMATCVPVRLDDGGWESAFFVMLAGPESRNDRRAMARRDGPFSMGLESDLVETDHGAVVVLRPELHTRSDDPLVAEILLTPGAGGAHHEALRLLAEQRRLSWFYGDGAGWTLYAQSLTLEDMHRAGFAELLAGALRHDTLIRLTRTYDEQAALGEVVRHYELRAAASGAAEPAA